MSIGTTGQIKEVQKNKSNSNIYEGTFSNGKLNGPGKLTTSDNVIFEGTFSNGKLIGCNS